MIEIEERLHNRALLHNHAFGGANSSHLVKRAAFEARAEVARFVVSVGTNDLAPWKRVEPHQFASNLRQFLGFLGPDRVSVIDLIPIDDGAPHLAGDPAERTAADVRLYRSVLSETVTRSGAALLHVATALDPTSAAHADDGVHLNPAGTSVFLTLIAAHLESALTSQP